MINYREKVNISRQRRRILFWLKFSFWFILIISGLGASLYILNQPLWQITAIEIRGASDKREEEILSQAQDFLNARQWYLIPRRNFIFTPLRRLNREILQKDINIYEIRSSLQGLKSLEIRVKEREPDYLWCRENNARHEPECFFVDKRGFIYSSAPYLATSFIPRISGRGFAEPLGRNILPAKQFSNLEDIIEAIGAILTEKEFMINILEIEINPNGDIITTWDVNGQMITRTTWSIIFYIEQEAQTLVEDFLSIFQNREFLSELENNKWELEYLDLRFDQRIFYRL